MLPHPLTPPHEQHTEAGNNYGVAYPGPGHFIGQGIVATPESNVDMGLEEPNEMSDIDGRPDELYVDDDDDDSMSGGGGAPLNMTISHAAALDAELDRLDAEIMGPANLVEIYMDQQFSHGMDPFPATNHGMDEQPVDPVDDEPSPHDTSIQNSGSLVNLPSAMSAVSLHLLQLQYEQENSEVVESSDDLHGSPIANSNPPTIFLNFLSNHNATNDSVEHAGQLAHISPAALHTVPTPGNGGLPLPVPQLWTTQGSTPSPALDVVVPDPLQNTIFSTIANPTDDAFDANQIEVEEDFNLHLPAFLNSWGTLALAHEDQKRRPRGPDLGALMRQRNQKMVIINQNDLRGERCDMQGIDWVELGVLRAAARRMRQSTYKNYQNLRLANQWHPRLNGAKLVDSQNYFRFRRMDFGHRVNLAHFQLRNVMACASRDRVFYAGKFRVMQWHPTNSDIFARPNVVMDLTNPIVQPFHAHTTGIQISTLAAAHNILVAGGFNGQYALVNLRAAKDSKHVEGMITDNPNAITNHAQVYTSRTSSSPQIAFASNDSGMRVLDVGTNKLVAEHHYDHPINCTAMSPDKRLRVLVGDTRDVKICDAATGEVLQSLEGHRDFGFACDWADDGWTVATGNQDMQVKIWDARKWRSPSGDAQPLVTIAAEMAGVRKLKFSPLGSGKRVLLAAEPADIISVIDADSYNSKQTLDFFGEIGGVDFTNGGRDIIVANLDPMRGGLMEFERCNSIGGDFDASEGFHSRYRPQFRRDKGAYDWMSDDDLDMHPNVRGTRQQRSRRAADLGSLPHF